MNRISFLLIVSIFSGNIVSGQMNSYTTANTTAIIITPVGIENSSRILSGNFYPGLSSGIIALNNTTGITNLVADQEKTTRLSFQVVSNQVSYDITLSFDPFIINRSAAKENMQIVSLTALLINEKKQEGVASDCYSIGATIQVGPSPVPGAYSSPNPYRVTINFN